jgi:hypothetical protein
MCYVKTCHISLILLLFKTNEEAHSLRELARTTEKGKQPAAQTKRTRTTSQARTTQQTLLATDYFAAALGALPSNDWCRTWEAGRTIMLRRTSKRVKEAVDKMRLPAVVHTQYLAYTLHIKQTKARIGRKK